MEAFLSQAEVGNLTVTFNDVNDLLLFVADELMAEGGYRLKNPDGPMELLKVGMSINDEDPVAIAVVANVGIGDLTITWGQVKDYIRSFPELIGAVVSPKVNEAGELCGVIVTTPRAQGLAPGAR